MTNDTTTASTASTVSDSPVEPCLIKVTTLDLRTGEHKSKIIDHGNFYDRKWLAKHCWWAMRNNNQVTTSPYNAGDGNNK